MALQPLEYSVNYYRLSHDIPGTWIFGSKAISKITHYNINQINMKKAACLKLLIFAFLTNQANAQTVDTPGISLQDTVSLKKMLCRKWTPLYLTMGERRRDIHPGEPSYLYLEFTADHRILITGNDKNRSDGGTWAIDSVKKIIMMTIGGREVDVASMTDASMATQVDSKLFRPDMPSTLLKTFYKPFEK
jgi:hypothetical protein